MAIFDDIKLGVEQAIEYEKGNLKAKKTTLTITPVEVFTAQDIKDIRNQTGLTQVLFARFMTIPVTSTRTRSLPSWATSTFRTWPPVSVQRCCGQPV